MSKCEFKLAVLQTEHFTFRALAADDRAAKRAILRGWKRHQKEYGFVAERNTVAELDDWYGISTYPVELNDCLRDDQLLNVR